MQILILDGPMITSGPESEKKYVSPSLLWHQKCTSPVKSVTYFVMPIVLINVCMM